MASDGNARRDQAHDEAAPGSSESHRATCAAAQPVADYLWDAEVSLAKIDRLLTQGPLGGSAPSADRLSEIQALVQEIRREAGPHGYHMASAIGQSLFDYIEDLGAAEAAQMQVVEIHVEALKTVVLGRITGQGGDRGKALIAGIEAVVAKLAES